MGLRNTDWFIGVIIRRMKRIKQELFLLSLCENWNSSTHLAKVRLQRSKGVQLKDDFAMEARQCRERAHTGGTDDHGFT